MEGSILLALQGIRIEGLTQLLALFSALGAGSIIWIVIAFLLLLFEERRQSGLILMVALILVSVVTALLATVIGRVCPADAVPGLVGVVGVSKAGYTMPSLYAATSFAAFYIVLRGVGKGAGFLAGLLAVLISFSRMYLGVAYPTDILAGAVLGLVIAFVLFAFLGKIFSLIDVQPKAQPQRKHVRQVRGSHSR